MAVAEEKMASLAKDLLAALETQYLEIKGVMDTHQDAIDLLSGASMMTSWAPSLVNSRMNSRRSSVKGPPSGPASHQASEVHDEWQSSVQSQEAGLSLVSDEPEKPEEEETEVAPPRMSTRDPANQTVHVGSMQSIADMKSKSSSTPQEIARLDIAVGIAVVLNSLQMAFELECQGHAVGVAVGIPDGMQCDDVAPFFVVLEHCFMIAYIAEVSYRFRLLRWGFFAECANWFDLLLVIIGAIDSYILGPLAAQNPNGPLLRQIRLFKLVRVVRLGRVFHLFPGLRLLVHACTSFLPALGWSMVLLSLCIMMGGLTMGTLLQDFILDENKPMNDRLWVWLHYGTAYRAMYTLYEVTFAGSWPTYARPVLETVSHAYVLFFLFYITLIVFAVIRVISAVFLSQTLEAANNDAEMMIQERMRKKAAFVQKLEGVFQAMDESGDGLLSEEEMSDLLDDPKVQAYLESLEVAVPESQALFRLLQNGDGQVTYEDFIEGILRCKGPARAMDQIVIQADIRALQTSLSQLLSSLEKAKVIAESRHCRSRHRKGTRTRLADELTLMQATFKRRKH